MTYIAKFALVSGIGEGLFQISSFDEALLNAGVGNYNLIRVSSILPSGCQKTSRIGRGHGEPLYMAYAALTVKEYVQAASAVAVAIPSDCEECGVIMEYSGNTTKENAIAIARHLALDGMKRRGAPVKEILTAGSESMGRDEMFVTTFAGVALY